MPVPGVGALVHVRQRQWLVESIVVGSATGECDRVDLACVDDDAQGALLSVLWQAELDARILDENPWERLGAKGFDDADVFAAYLHTRRWNSVTSTDPSLFQAPFRAGIRIDTYQLEPLRKALALPRVNLFIADDVGLGKTIEAGLIARELLLRRKITSIVVIAPPSMLPQWQEELEARFGLSFQIIDREYFTKVRRERGYQVNPWRTHSLFLLSNRRLIDETYASLLHDWLGDFKSQSLLILDEAHHAAPSSGGRYAIDSQITRVVRDLSRRFEHRLFLSATPHNGHSNSFSALLEILDPNRFVRGMDIREGDLAPVMVRRIKDDIRALEGGFPERKPEQIDIDGLPEDAPELVLSRLLDEYAALREQQVAQQTPARRAQARLVLVNLQKRLLSSVAAFARTIAVHKRAIDRVATSPAVNLELRRSEAELALELSAPGANDDVPPGDDDAWEKRTGEALGAATEAVFAERSDSRRDARARQILDELVDLADRYTDIDDARIHKLMDWIDAHQCPGILSHTPSAAWNTRRLIIFTEWEDTRRYIERRLKAAIEHTERAEERIAIYSGATPLPRRDALKHAFNTDPAENPIRILIATDSAREGLNLQRHCYDLVHFDLPWNPSRIEQRNGRIDRKLQPSKVVYCRYFFYHQRPEDRVLQALVRKTETIRKELGALADVLEERTETLLRGGIRRGAATETSAAILAINSERAVMEAAKDLAEGEGAVERRDRIRREIDSLRGTLERSRRAAGVDGARLRHALDVGLARAGSRPLRQSAPLDNSHPALFEVAVDGTRLASDPSWFPALDLLRTRRLEGDVGQWRREAPLRPVTFDEPGEIGESAVQLHLEHRFVRRVLGRFVAKGLIDDLSRACLAISPTAVPRVVLIGRVSLYGSGGSRLHEEIIEVAARWADPRDRGDKPLQPYRDTAEEKTLDFLEEALVAPKALVPREVAQRLLESLASDVADLLPYLEQRSNSAASIALEKLARRAQVESDAMRDLLADQAKRIVQTQKEKAQLSLFGAEEDQLKANMRYWEQRLGKLDQLRATEPQRILDAYAVKARRFEPVGVAYLWPVTG